MARTYGLTFRLPDPLIQVYRDHLKIDLTRFNGDDSWELAVPATYVIEPGGRVAYGSADADYTRRPEPDDLLAALDDLQTGDGLTA